MKAKVIKIIVLLVLVSMSMSTSCTSTSSSASNNAYSGIEYRPSGLTLLTEQQKAELIAIASQNSTVREAIASSSYQTGFEWVGVLNNGAGHGVLPYTDTVEKGIPVTLTWTKEATIYPGVTFHFGTHVITVAVDLNKKQVMYVTGGPIRSGPRSK